MSKERTPQVSVLLPVHNGMPFLPLAVESLLSQTFSDFELIALDDGSTDASADYLKSLQDPRVRYVRLDRVRLVGALNHGLEMARGELIARMDADDVSLPRRFELQVGMFEDDPGLVLCGAQAELVDPDGQPLPQSLPGAGKLGDAVIRWYMLFSGAFVHPATMFRKKLAEQIGGYRTMFDVAEDFDFWTRLAVHGRCGNHPEVLIQYRQHGGSVSALNQTRQLEQCSRIAAEYASQVLPDVGEETWFRFRQFLVGAAGQESVDDIWQLRRAFRQCVALGREMAAGCEELNEWVEFWRSRLRWRAQAAARGALPDIRRAWQWLQVAHDCGFGCESVLRRWRQALPGAVAHECQEVDLASCRPNSLSKVKL